MPDISHRRRDATGARSGLPCQDVWYYHTHLALNLNSNPTSNRTQIVAIGYGTIHLLTRAMARACSLVFTLSFCFNFDKCILTVASEIPSL